jgi:tetratricopeptide (TPR) repeat protein
MAEIDKAKILREAFDYQHKGQHDRAIDELRKILKVHPRDTRTLQKVAELQSKKGDRKEAVKSYTQLAEIYEKDGFVDFAISVYKTVLNMDDGLFDVNLKLGKLFLKKNLRGEALASLQAALKLCGDNKREKVEILEKIIEANPGDVSAIERLADHYYFDLGKADPAKNVLRKGAETMKNAFNFDGAHKFYEKILKMDSKDELALKAVAELEACAGKPKGAADIYEKILESNPNDIETLKKAAELYSVMEDTEREKLCLGRLASVYKFTDSDADLTEVYEKILSLDPSDPEAVEFMELKNRASEITIDDPSPEECGLRAEAFSFLDNPNSLGQESTKEDNGKLEIILDSEPKYTDPKDSLNQSHGSPVMSSLTELVETVNSEEELKKARIGWEEGSNVLDINREDYKKNEKAEIQDATPFKRAITENLHKTANSAFYERGVAYNDMKMTEQAVLEFRKSIGEGYKVPESYMMIGLCFLQRGDGKKALAWFQKGLSLDGLAVEQVVNLKSGSALALGVMGSISEAVKLLEEIVEVYEGKG